jgi:hypothetical protein
MLYGQKRTGTLNFIKEWIRMLDDDKKERNISGLLISGYYGRHW